MRAGKWAAFLSSRFHWNYIRFYVNKSCQNNVFIVKCAPQIESVVSGKSLNNTLRCNVGIRGRILPSTQENVFSFVSDISWWRNTVFLAHANKHFKYYQIKETCESVFCRWFSGGGWSRCHLLCVHWPTTVELHELWRLEWRERDVVYIK